MPQPAGPNVPKKAFAIISEIDVVERWFWYHSIDNRKGFLTIPNLFVLDKASAAQDQKTRFSGTDFICVGLHTCGGVED